MRWTRITQRNITEDKIGYVDMGNYDFIVIFARYQASLADIFQYIKRLI